MLIFRSLENVEISTLNSVFNQAFSDYLLPFTISETQLRQKFRTENIALNYSVGAFDGGNLVAFIFHFYADCGEHKILYNGGTGVIKEYRNKGLTAQMYSFILPKIKDDHFRYISLEVLQNNVQAIRSYQRVGFVEQRDLLCFKGQLHARVVTDRITYRKLVENDWERLPKFWDFKPTWQNAMPTVRNLKDVLVGVGAYQDDILLGYILFNPQTNRIQQLAVDLFYRRQGIGQSLLAQVQQQQQAEISVINVDSASQEMIRLLKYSGLHHYVNQKEFIRYL